MSKVAHNFKDKSRTGDVLITESVDFGSLLLSNSVLRGLKNSGFVKPSPIQLKAIPLGRCGLDLIVQAKSGTGKTCVFSVIALESILTDTASTQVLVLAPTREIAVQIWEVIKSIGSAIKDLECHTFIGGLPLQEDRLKLKKCHIAVGSPGRIKQLIECGALHTDSVRLFVLDEADKLLEESFQEQINWIYSTLPENKQMLALSATYPEYLAEHLTAYMRNPTFLRLNISDPALLGIRQYYHTVPYHPLSHVVFEEKTKVLINILSSVSFEQCLVFSNLQTRAQTLADNLTHLGWPTACIAGCLDQKDRNQAMARLKTYKCRILISTDLTSRGIDADKVNMVINLDVPPDHETYLHRIGRAGRFGSFGIAVTLISDGKERLDLDLVEKKCNTQIYRLPDPLPSDLAKPGCPIFLDDLVSSEVIDTARSHTTQKMGNINGQIGNSSKSRDRNINKHRYRRNDCGKTPMHNIGDAVNCKDNGITVSEITDLSHLSHENGVTASGKEIGNVDHVWNVDFETPANDRDAGRDAVSYEGVDYNEITNFEVNFHAEDESNTDLMNESSMKDINTVKCKLFHENAAMSQDQVETTIDEDLKVEEKAQSSEVKKENVDVSESHKEKLLTANVSKLGSVDGENSKELSVGQNVHLADVQTHRNCKLPSLPFSNISVSQLFKTNIGHKKLDKSHTYLTARESLKTCRDKLETETEHKEIQFDCSIPKVETSGIVTETAREAVDQLLEMLEKRVCLSKRKNISKVEVDGIENKDESVESHSISSEDEFEAKAESLNKKYGVEKVVVESVESDSISSEDEFEAKAESLNKKDGFEKVVVESVESDSSEDEFEAKAESWNKKSDSPVPYLGKEVFDKHVCDIDKELESKEEKLLELKYDSVNDNSTLQEKSKRAKSLMSKPRRTRFGYNGNFAIGHLLQQQRAEDLHTENQDIDSNQLQGYKGLTEEVITDGRNNKDIQELDRSENLDLGRTEKDRQVCSDVKASSNRSKEESKVPNILSPDRKYLPNIAGDQDMNREDIKERDTFNDDLISDSDSETDPDSSEAESESVEEVMETKNKGARPKTCMETTCGVDSRQYEKRKSSKQGRDDQKEDSKSKKESDKEQNQWKQWNEQYEKLCHEMMKLWGYPQSSYQPQTSSESPWADIPNYGYMSAYYPTPPMYHPLYNQYIYPYDYQTQYSQHSANMNTPGQMENQYKVQEEYLKQMTAYWKKAKKKSYT